MGVEDGMGMREGCCVVVGCGEVGEKMEMVVVEKNEK